MGFVHLHVHSQFSLLDGTADPSVLVARAAELGMEALALTDTCNLFGAVNFYSKCKDMGVRPILGAELHVQPEGLSFRDARRERGGYQIIALVTSEVGYHNLCQLITSAIFDGNYFKPRVDLSLLQAHCEGLIFLTGGRAGAFAQRAGERTEPGPLPLEQALARVDQLQAFLASDQLYLELQSHGLQGQEAINARARELSAARGVPLVVTNAVHYLEASDTCVHEVLNAIGAGTSMADDRRILSTTDQAWFKSEQEMLAVFPDDADAIALSGQIAARCRFDFVFDVYHFPATTPPDFVPGKGVPQPDTDANWDYFFRAFPPPLDFGLPLDGDLPARPDGAGNLNGYFEWYAIKGLALRLQQFELSEHQTYHDRLRVELDIIEDMGFPAYMLIVAEFINWSKDAGIPVGPGRGSAAGSLVAWSMRITDIDPIRFGLLFERFLNPDRVSMPDIDVDFCQDRREEAIAHVRDKYGKDLVAQIITYGKLKAKAAVRDVARVLDLSFNEADRVAKLIPDTLGIKLSEAIEQVEGLRVMRAGDPKVRRVLNLAQAVEGACRQTGVHAAGVVVADRPLVHYAPLYRDSPEGGPVVHYDMSQVEKIGLIKFDFLGLKTLDQIRDAVVFIEQNHGIKVDMSAIPDDDALTFELLQAGDALGVFQLESSGMRELLARLKPNCIEDMVALVALYRPGPLQSGMVDDFVERKHGRTAVNYPLPMLEPLLNSTYGTIIYQEQVMQIAQVMAGYSLGEADLLRRAMGKKKASEMDKQKVRFVEGSVANDIPRQKAEEIFNLLAKFAAYGFNKSHSAAYGYISYQTAWLKAHYRPEYMAALMTIESANTDKVLQYILDCRAADIRIEPVCLNASLRSFKATAATDDNPGVIRFGLAAVKNVGSGAIEALLDARKRAGGSFRTAFHVFEWLDYGRVNKRVIESLIKAGAFDFSGEPRASVLAGLEAAMSLGARRAQDRDAGQVGLFSMLAPSARPVDFRFPVLGEWALSQRLAFELEVLGLYLSGHPMEAYAGDVQRYGTTSLSGLAAIDLDGDNEVRLVGLPGEVRVVRTKRGDRMAFVRLEDVNGAVECTFFSDAWLRSQVALKAGRAVLISGRVEERDGERKVLASSAELVADVRARSVREVCLRVDLAELDATTLKALVALLDAQRGSVPSRMVVRAPGRYQAELVMPAHPVEPSLTLQESVNRLFGREVVGLN